jgi:hypothetical protein
MQHEENFMSITKLKALGTAILLLAIVLAGCNPEVTNITSRRGYKAAGTITGGAPPVTNQTLAAPAGVTAVLAAGRVRVSWNAVPGAASYRVNYGDPNDPTMRYYVIVEAPLTYWEDIDVLDDGKTYHYQVQAVNAGGEIGRVSSVSSQTFTSTPPATNPFLGTWRDVTNSSHTFVFSDHSVSHNYGSDSASGSYTYSGNHATLTMSYSDHIGVYTANITGPNSLHVDYGTGYSDNFTK